MTVKILDCTLRDGGYYNKWDFSHDLVLDYLDAMANSGVDYVELGLRSFESDGFLGASAFTTRNYIKSLNLPKGPLYGVMIDAKTVLTQDCSQEKSIDLLFESREKEQIGLVRVAAHFHEVDQCFPMLSRLKEKGYVVGLNIMQASLKESKDLSSVAKLIQGWNCVDVLYFADSLGSMHEKDMERIYDALSLYWKGEIGFHAHNNMGQALNNVSKAIKLGCKWIDGTVTGMGRGAGNAELEYIMTLPELDHRNVETKALFKLVDKHFTNMKQECGWGASLSYFYGAKFGIHPTYVQDLLSRKLESEVVFDVLHSISNIEKPQTYKKDILDKIISKCFDKDTFTEGSIVPDIFNDREVILVAQTEVSQKYLNAILCRKETNNSILIAINEPIPELNLPYDYVVISHNEKVWQDSENYINSNYSYICPKDLFQNSSVNCAYDYGVEVVEGCFESHETYAKIPARLTLPYAISFCHQAKAESINLVGFGGYQNLVDKQKQMQIFIELLLNTDIQLWSLTPTSYTIKERSIYAPF